MPAGSPSSSGLRSQRGETHRDSRACRAACSSTLAGLDFEPRGGRARKCYSQKVAATASYSASNVVAPPPQLAAPVIEVVQLELTLLT